MPSLTRLLRAAAGTLTLLFVGGCYSTYPHGYGPGSGVYYVPPSGFTAPPATYGTPGTYGAPSLGQPQTIPGGSAPSPGTFTPPTNSGSGSSSGDPTFRPESNSANSFPKEDPVPLYDDPNRVDDMGGGAGAANGELPQLNGEDFQTPFGDGAAARFDGEGGASETASRILPASSGTLVRDAAPQANGGFQEPVPVQPASISRELAPDEHQADPPNPYDYDRQKYTWLRGKVDYDEASKSWHIIYNIRPDSDDRYGGGLTLVSSPMFEKLRNDDVVLLEGRIDPETRDRRGKPCYRVDHLFGPLVPNQVAER